MVFRLVFGLLMIPFVLMFAVGAVLFAVFAAISAALMPLMPLALIALAIPQAWAGGRLRVVQQGRSE